MFGWISKITAFGKGRSPNWRAVREAHLKTQPNCQACGRDRDLDVHHIVPVKDNPDLELEPSNLITLCGSPCHLVHGHFMSWFRCNPYVVKDCTRYRQRLEASKAKSGE